MQCEWVIIGLLVLMALGLVDIRIALFGILRREKAIMATEQQLADILSSIGSDVDQISNEFTDFTNTIASLQGQLAQAGHSTDISSDLMDRASAIKAKLDALAGTVSDAGSSAPTDTPPSGDGSDTLVSANGNDTLPGSNGSDQLDTGDNGPPPNP